MSMYRAVGMSVGLAMLCAGGASPAHPLDGPTDGSARGLNAIAWPERIGIERALAADALWFRPYLEANGPEFGPTGRIGRARFTANGAAIALGSDSRTTLGLAAIGRDGQPMPLDAEPTIAVAGPEVRIERAPGVTEWWRSLPSGLEQGVTIAERPAGRGALELEIATDAHTRLEMSSEGDVLLRDDAGEMLAHYTHLLVTDADGATVPAALAVADGRIRIEVADDDARYPLVVDPLVVALEATIIAADGGVSDLLGSSIASSLDGSRVVVGAYADTTPAGSQAGSARVYLRTGTTWTLETTLLAPDGDAGDHFGFLSIGISPDGSRIVVGAQRNDVTTGDDGSAYVFLRTGTTWTSEAEVYATAPALRDFFGASVAISGDGARMIVGAPGTDTAGGVDAGSAYVFVRAGSAWTLESMLVASDGAAGDTFGQMVAIDDTGSRAIIGDYLNDTAAGVDAGSARIFVRSGSTWTEEATLQRAGLVASDSFGWSVAMTPDGTRVLIGDYLDDTAGGADAGSATVFVRAGTSWSEEATLTAADGAGNDQLGFSVSLSADGTRALVGAPLDDSSSGDLDVGSVRTFVRTGSTWTATAPLVTAAGLTYDRLGYSVGLAGDGSRAAVGAIGLDTAGGVNAGGFLIFTVMASVGLGCGADAACESGFCPDGVCCATACSGGTNDCQACSVAAGAATDGVCGALNAATAAATTCRPIAGACDSVAEVCTSSSTVCPMDVVSPNGTTCRLAASVCDTAEVCNGVSPLCPADAQAPAGTECRPANGVCDAPETCSGAGGPCPADVNYPDGTSCPDGIACNGDETCQAGACTVGTTPTCDDSNLCTADACAEPGGCMNVAIALCCNIDADCNDGDGCTGDMCSGAGGTCSHVPLTVCVDGGIDGGVDAAIDVDAFMPGDGSVLPDAGVDGGARDAGHDAGRDGGGVDANIDVDTGTAPATPSTCGCAAAGTGGGTGAAPIGLIGLALVLARRRRKR